jgi:hypothetical protein
MNNVAEICSWTWEGGDPSVDLDGAIILFGIYNTYDYEGDALVLYVKEGKLYKVASGHCSCNGLTWEPEEIDEQHLEELFLSGNRMVEEEVKEARRLYDNAKIKPATEEEIAELIEKLDL